MVDVVGNGNEMKWKSEAEAAPAPASVSLKWKGEGAFVFEVAGSLPCMGMGKWEGRMPNAECRMLPCAISIDIDNIPLFKHAAFNI